MNSTDLRRCAVRTPRDLGQIIRLLLLVLQQVTDRRRELLHSPRLFKQIHFVVLVAHLIRQTARPRLDLIELM